MPTLWYALFKGDLCRIRHTKEGRLVCEVWRDGSWLEGPDFSEVDFTGRMITEDEALEWIKARFREKRIKSSAPEKPILRG